MIPVILGALAGAVGGYVVSKKFSGNEDFYTTKDAAEILGISEYTVRKKIREKNLKAEVIPGKSGFRIRKSDLDEYQGKKKSFIPADTESPNKFGDLTQKILESILSSHEIDDVTQELLQHIIEGRQSDLKGLQLRLKQLELDADDSIEFQKKKISLEIAINDLEAEIQAYQTAEIAIRDMKNSAEKNNLR